MIYWGQDNHIIMDKLSIAHCSQLTKSPCWGIIILTDVVTHLYVVLRHGLLNQERAIFICVVFRHGLLNRERAIFICVVFRHGLLNQERAM